MTDQLLHEIVYELRALRREITQRDIDTVPVPKIRQIQTKIAA